MNTVYDRDNERLWISTVVKDTEYCGIVRPTELHTYKCLNGKKMEKNPFIYKYVFKAK